MRILAFAVLLAGISAGFVVAESATIKYMEGACDLQSGKDWTKLKTGSSIDDQAVVRLGASAMLVLERSDATVSLTKAGTYKIGDVLTVSKKASSSNLASIIGKKVETAANGSKTTATAGGVRASDAVNQASTIKMDDGNPFTQLGNAKVSLLDSKEKNLSAAKTYFDNAVSYATAKEKDDVLVQIGELSLLSNYPSLAISYLTKNTLAANSPRYSEFVLIKARVLFESLNFDDAKAFCEASVKTAVSPKAKQGLLIIQGLSERSLGQESKAVALFDMAIKENPSNDEGQLASKLKKSA